MLILAKSNLGRLDVPALRYRVEGRTVPTDDGDQIATSGIEWLGEVDGIGAVDIFSSNDPEERSMNQERGEVLREILADGSLERKVVISRLKESGYPVTGKILQRLCTDLGIRRERGTFGGPVRLALPSAHTGHRGLSSQEPVQNVQNVQNESDQGLCETPDGHSGHSGHSGRDVGEASGMDAQIILEDSDHPGYEDENQAASDDQAWEATF